MKFREELNAADETIGPDHHSFWRSIRPIAWLCGILQGVFVIFGVLSVLAGCIFADSNHIVAAIITSALSLILLMVICLFVWEIGRPKQDSFVLVRFSIGMLLGVAAAIAALYFWLTHTASYDVPAMLQPISVFELGPIYQVFSWPSVIVLGSVVVWIACSLLMLEAKLLFWRQDQRESGQNR